MRFTGNTEAEIIQFDNPLVILLRKREELRISHD